VNTNGNVFRPPGINTMDEGGYFNTNAEYPYDVKLDSATNNLVFSFKNNGTTDGWGAAMLYTVIIFYR